MQGADDLVDENDYLTYLNQGAYELRSGSAEVAIEYLDQAIRSEPEDEILFIMRCKCLIKYAQVASFSLTLTKLNLSTVL